MAGSQLTAKPRTTAIQSVADAKKAAARMKAHEAMGLFHKQQGEHAQANEHAKAMLDLRRQLGWWYLGIQRKVGRPKKGNTDVTILQEAAEALGHNKMTRRRLEKEAEIPARAYEKWATETAADGESLLTAAGLRKLGRAPKPYEPPAIDFDPPQVWRSSWEEWLPSQPDCDLLLTDPPYMTDVEDVSEFAYEWLPVALDKVKQTGRAYVCIGAYPDELYAYLAIEPPCGSTPTTLNAGTTGASWGSGARVGWGN